MVDGKIEGESAREQVRQFEALERVLDEGRDCSEVLQIISAARGAVNSLMTELLEGHKTVCQFPRSSISARM